MKTKLDERQELLQKVGLMTASELQKLKVFLLGLEAGKAIRESEQDRAS